MDVITKLELSAMTQLTNNSHNNKNFLIGIGDMLCAADRLLRILLTFFSATDERDCTKRTLNYARLAATTLSKYIVLFEFLQFHCTIDPSTTYLNQLAREFFSDYLHDTGWLVVFHK